LARSQGAAPRDVAVGDMSAREGTATAGQMVPGQSAGVSARAEASSVRLLAGEACRLCEDRLAILYPDTGSSSPADAALGASMRHTLLGPGKRTRATLTILTCQALGGRPESAVETACALELLHAASLILDDLPIMDNAEQRRGQPTNHKVYGEPTAVLASVALITDAFRLVGEDAALQHGQKAAVASHLARASGRDGLALGQLEDLRASRSDANPAAVSRIHRLKTARLFAAATATGAVIAGADRHVPALDRFGEQLGLGFQALDDVLDVRARHSRDVAAAAGKDAGLDEDKATLVAALGEAAADEQAHRHFDQAREALGDLPAEARETLSAYADALLIALKARYA